MKSCGFVDITLYGTRRVYVASSVLEGPPEPSKSMLCQLWAAGFIVICTNQTIGLFLGTLVG